MIGIVVVTHLDFGERLLRAAEMIMGPQQACVSVSLDISADMHTVLQELKDAVRATEQGEGVLVLTDMFGGTPSNLSLSLLSSNKLEVMTGVNLPMLLKILGGRNKPLAEVVSEAKAAGRQGILVAGEVLRRKVANG